MAVIKSRGAITIVDQNDAVQVQVYIASNQPRTQVYTQDNNSYNPSWAAAPYLVLTPQVFITGVIGDVAGVAGRIKSGSVQWRRDGVLLTNSADYVISATAPYGLTIKKNDIAGSGNVTYEFSAVFVDPNNGLESTIKASIPFTSVKNSSAGLLARVTPDAGDVFSNEDTPYLTLMCELLRGSELLTTNVQYTWAIRDDKVFSATTASAASAIGVKTITLASVTNISAGSEITAAGVTYTVASVNPTTRVVTLTSNLTAAVASGSAVTSPHYDATFGAGWAKISSNPYFNGITGFTTKTLVVPSAAVLNIEVFKCIAKDTSTGTSTAGQSSYDVATLRDMSDPIKVDVWSPDGTVIKNGSGSINLKADVQRGGELVDLDGTEYIYSWTKYNNNGVIDASFTRSGKNITILPSDVSVKATFICTLLLS